MKKILYRILMITGLLLLLYLIQFPLENLERQFDQPQKLTLTFPLPENVLINYNLDNDEVLKLDIEKVIVTGFFSAWDIENDKYVMKKTGDHQWEYLMEDFEPGENAYKYVIFVKGWAAPIWTHDIKKKTTDDSFGGFNSVYTIPNIRGLRTLVNLLLAGSIILLLLYTILEPLIRWILVLRLPFRVKLTLSMLLVPLITNLAFIFYNIYEIRQIIKQGLIDNMNQIHLVLEGAGIDFNELHSYKNQRIFQREMKKVLANARVRIEKNKLANIQITLSDFFITDTHLEFIFSQSRDEVLDIERESQKRLGYKLRRDFLQTEFLDHYKQEKVDWSQKPRRIFLTVPSRMLGEYSRKYQHILPWLGFNTIVTPIMIQNELKGFYVGMIEVEMLGMEVRRIFMFNLILLASIAILMIIIYLNMGGIISSHLEELTEWTRFIIKGNFNVEKKIATNDEIEDLARNFDAMRLTMGQNMNNLKLLNLVTANLHHVTNVDDLYNVFLTFITANFGFEYNRAIIFLVDDGVLQGRYAIGKLDETELLETFGSRSNYTNLRLDAMDFMANYRGKMKPKEGRLSKVARGIVLEKDDRSILWDVYNRQAVFYVHDREMFFHLKDKQLQSLLDLDECAFLPVYKGEQAIGVLFVDNYFQKKPIREEDINQLQIIINDFSANLENSYIIQNLEKLIQERTAELRTTYSDLKKKDLIMSTDLSIAQKIQKSLLMYRPQELHDIDMEIIYDPMGEVGGDIYDIFRIKEGRIRVFIADATGHGVQAALVTMLIKSEYEKIKRIEKTPARILEKLNLGFIRNYPYLSFFFTCIVVDIDIKAEKVTWSSGGHPPQSLIHSHGVRELHSTGKILGLEENSVYTNKASVFHKGDKLLLFTDGIYEQFNALNVEYGDERLMTLIHDNQNQDLKSLVAIMYKSVQDFIGSGQLNDDITIIGMELNPDRK